MRKERKKNHGKVANIQAKMECSIHGNVKNEEIIVVLMLYFIQQEV